MNNNTYNDAFDHEGYDYDWFGIDINDVICHFTSAGRLMPQSVLASKTAYDILYAYFLNLPDICEDIELTAEAKKYREISIERGYFYPDMGNMYDFYIKVSKKGLYSFDAEQILNIPEDPIRHYYCLNSYPKKTLSKDDLPGDILELLQRTRILKDVKQHPIISIVRPDLHIVRPDLQITDFDVL